MMYGCGSEGGGAPTRRSLDFSFQLQRAALVASVDGRQSQRDNVTIVKQAENEQSCSFDDMHSDQREEPIKEPEKNQ